MTNSVSSESKAQQVIVGVDTHKDVHVAVAIDTRGTRLGDHVFVANAGGYRALIRWADTHGRVDVRRRRHRQLWRRSHMGGAPRRASGASAINCCYPALISF